MRSSATKLSLICISLCGLAATGLADPCGMIPPIYTGDSPPITRIGEQQTYVFFKNGIESIAIRPGFEGQVDTFGMLIPFPKPPAIRKLPDHIFPHIAAAIDPPEVVIDLRRQFWSFRVDSDRDSFSLDHLQVGSERGVKVLREEAVGMYEVAVLEAGSSAALKRWMDQHEYQYPKGMDKVCDEYVQQKWCFVAVKTLVAKKSSADPRPGQRQATPQLPLGATFDGYVQAMGFRFKSDKLVVPMRLSAFNDGELRNVVYILSDGPKKIRSIPEEYVVRQVRGDRLYLNVTDPLPLRIIGGTVKDLQPYHVQNLAARRDPNSENGAAKELFAADLTAAESNTLSLTDEEEEKELLRIGEHLGLRGSEIDKANADALHAARDKTVRESLAELRHMTLTVVDGDFPRDVLADQNLTFAYFAMPSDKNNPLHYDALRKAPRQKRAGTLKYGEVGLLRPAKPVRRFHWPASVSLLLGLLLVSAGVLRHCRFTARASRDH